EPCAVVSAASASFLVDYPQATAAYVNAEDAVACLKSVPIQKDEDKALMNEILLYLSWQSNIAYIADPPAGYTEERVDILDNLKAIYKKLDGDGYDDEYTFQLDLSTTITEAYDFHLYFVADILGIFIFSRGNLFGDGDELSLTSLSSDGKALPELYNVYDIIKERTDDFKASPITEINNKTASEYLNDWAKTYTYHDKDARYERNFYNQAGASIGQPVDSFASGRYPDGASTFITFKNGTSVEFFNYAKINADMSNVASGEEFFSAFCNQGPPSPNSKVKREPTLTSRADPTATGYPDAVLLHSEGVIGGYYLEGQGYDDVAVLGIPSFGPESDKGGPEFQDVVFQFFADATAKGKKKLVIDTRANGGGRVFLGFDLFKQLFPTLEPWGATRYRANEAFDVVGQALSKQLEGYTYEQAIADFNSKGLDSLLAAAWSSIFNYKVPMTVDGQNFTSWKDMFGPNVFNNDNFTDLQRYNFNNFFSDDLTLDVSGYRTRANKLGPQPFQPENIVILQDGGCGSTCAIFAELMKAQGHVQQVVIGGQPKTGAMQGVAGSKGAQVLNFLEVFKQASSAYKFLTDDQDKINGTELGALVQAQRPLMRAGYSADGSPFAAVNLRDNIREGDNSNTPLEFVYEAADCKLFYTPDLFGDVTEVWKAAVDARWSNGKGCVEGSTSDKSSISGG
ncbi:peptidase S41 family protein, partial [Lophium mytilinum]